MSFDEFDKVYKAMSEETLDLSPAENPINFEDFKNENGITFWWASDFMRMLGYRDIKAFSKPLDRATKACITLQIPYHLNFISQEREVGGEKITDFKLTRFACYLTAMNADVKKPEVAAAQVYFVEQTRRFELFIDNGEQLERVLIRDEIKEGNKSLNKVASSAGVVDYARFCNAGYYGLYNMLNVDLAKKRNIDSKQLFEHMGRTELAANLFRITQTEERIKNFSIRGQSHLERTHLEVGKEVRGIIIKNTGKTPEQLPVERRLPDVQKELKKGYKNMLKQDSKPKIKNKDTDI